MLLTMANRAIKSDTMGRRPAKFPKATHLGIRIDDATAKALDAEVVRANAASPGLVLGRSDIVRMLIAEALAARAKGRK
jgi:hypothetical protein